jgi:pilus assembly protein TadC
MDNLVPVLGILTGIIIPLSVFVWLYHEEKGKRETVLEIAKHIYDPSKVEDLLSIFDERKKQPIDYRRGGVITLFVGVGIYLLGAVVMGKFFEGVGLLVGAIGVGTMIAGYFFPNTSEELTDAVEKFEEK